MTSNRHYLFGPVPSRRLGRSLGIDLIPFKTCTMDCIYCQLGETTCEVSERGDYVPIQDVLTELDQWKRADGEADHITLAGSGEPTLHSYFGDVLQWVKDETDIPSVLLTNGTLLHMAAVREQAALANKVKVTLSAWDEASFQQIHRPAQGVTFEMLIKGERAFRKMFPGEFSVEVFIVDGINSQMPTAKRIAEVVKTLEPDRVDINTVVRPPAVKGVSAPPQEQLEELARLFGENASVTASFRKQGFTSLDITDASLLDLIRRHPATCEQLATYFNVPGDGMYRRLKMMKSSGLLVTEKTGGETYYLVPSGQ
ncbi:MAG: radical SAM protein [Pontiellaceae bacterium]|nr:radical SAM protein [Pontiellaceae bacterium]MBN2784647.1 radical SAM protein [Pontiellaceae bacterium]